MIVYPGAQSKSIGGAENPLPLRVIFLFLIEQIVAVGNFHAVFKIDLGDAAGHICSNSLILKIN